MPRKNIRATRVRKDRRIKGEPRAPKAPRYARVEVEDIVMPDGRCDFGVKRPKARFSTEAKAAKALEQAKRQRARNGTGHAEKRYYACPEGGCGGYHLTSREAYIDGPRRQDGKP